MQHAQSGKKTWTMPERGEPLARAHGPAVRCGHYLGKSFTPAQVAKRAGSLSVAPFCVVVAEGPDVWLCDSEHVDECGSCAEPATEHAAFGHGRLPGVYVSSPSLNAELLGLHRFKVQVFSNSKGILQYLKTPCSADPISISSAAWPAVICEEKNVPGISLDESHR